MTEQTTPIRISVRVTAACARQKAFDYVSDLRTHPQWSLDGIRVLEADSGPVGVGWKCRTVGHSEVQRGDQEAEIEITTYEPPQEFAFRAVSHRTHVFDNVFHFREVPGGTEIERVFLHDAPAETIARLKEVGAEVGRRREASMQMLKERLEAGA